MPASGSSASGQPALSTLPGRLSTSLQMWWQVCGQMGVSSRVDTWGCRERAIDHMAHLRESVAG